MALTAEQKKHLLEGGLLIGGLLLVYWWMQGGAAPGGAIETRPPLGLNAAPPPSDLTINYPSGGDTLKIPDVGNVTGGPPMLPGLDFSGGTTNLNLGSPGAGGGAQCGCCSSPPAQGDAVPSLSYMPLPTPGSGNYMALMADTQSPFYQTYLQAYSDATVHGGDPFVLEDQAGNPVIPG